MFQYSCRTLPGFNLFRLESPSIGHCMKTYSEIMTSFLLSFEYVGEPEQAADASIRLLALQQVLRRTLIRPRSDPSAQKHLQRTLNYARSGDGRDSSIGTSFDRAKSPTKTDARKNDYCTNTTTSPLLLRNVKEFAFQQR